MPSAVPRLQANLAYIWSTLNLSAADTRQCTAAYTHCGTASGARSDGSLSNHNRGDGESGDFTASANAQKSRRSTVKLLKRHTLRKWRKLADAWPRFWTAKYKEKCFFLCFFPPVEEQSRAPRIYRQSDSFRLFFKGWECLKRVRSGWFADWEPSNASVPCVWTSTCCRTRRCTRRRSGRSRSRKCKSRPANTPKSPQGCGAVPHRVCWRSCSNYVLYFTTLWAVYSKVSRRQLCTDLGAEVVVIV